MHGSRIQIYSSGDSAPAENVLTFVCALAINFSHLEEGIVPTCIFLLETITLVICQRGRNGHLLKERGPNCLSRRSVSVFIWKPIALQVFRGPRTTPGSARD